MCERCNGRLTGPLLLECDFIFKSWDFWGACKRGKFLLIIKTKRCSGLAIERLPLGLETRNHQSLHYMTVTCIAPTMKTRRIKPISFAFFKNERPYLRYPVLNMHSRGITQRANS